MQLDGAYEFFELNQSDGIFVSRAREKSTGRPAQCHLFPADKAAEASQISTQILEPPRGGPRQNHQIRAGWRDELLSHRTPSRWRKYQGVDRQRDRVRAAGRRPRCPRRCLGRIHQFLHGR